MSKEVGRRTTLKQNNGLGEISCISAGKRLTATCLFESQVFYSRISEDIEISRDFGRGKERCGNLSKDRLHDVHPRKQTIRQGAQDQKEGMSTFSQIQMRKELKDERCMIKKRVQTVQLL